MTVRYEIEGGNFTRAGYASSEVKKLLKQLSVDPVVIKRIVIALYEGEVNVVAHAWSGSIELTVDPDKAVIVIDDRGPGIEDIPRAMERGYSTATPEVREMGFGAGMGLPNIQKNVDLLDVKSTVGQGTTVTMTTWFDGRGNKD